MMMVHFEVGAVCHACIYEACEFHLVKRNVKIHAGMLKLALFDVFVDLSCFPLIFHIR